MLSEFPTKHASNSPITFVTLKSFVIRFFLPCCSVNSLMIKDDWRGVRPRLQLTRLPPAFHQPSLLRRRQKRQERIGGRGDGKLEEGIGERFLFTLSRQPPKPPPPRPSAFYACHAHNKHFKMFNTYIAWYLRLSLSDTEGLIDDAACSKSD